MGQRLGAESFPHRLKDLAINASENMLGRDTEKTSLKGSHEYFPQTVGGLVGKEASVPPPEDMTK